MHTVPRPGTVVAAAVLAFVHAALLLVGLAGLLSTVVRLSRDRPGAVPTSSLPGLLGVSVLFPLVLAALEVVAATGVLRGGRTARVLLTVTAGLLLVQAVIGIVTSVGHALPPSPYLFAGVVLSVAVVVLLWVPASRRWFAPLPR